MWGARVPRENLVIEGLWEARVAGLLRGGEQIRRRCPGPPGTVRLYVRSYCIFPFPPRRTFPGDSSAGEPVP